MNGDFKEVYADNMEILLPESSQLQKDLIYVRKEQREGNLYHQPVTLTGEHGGTYAGGANTGTAYALNAPIAANSKDAQIQGTEFMLRATMAIGAAAKAASSTAAFVDATEYMVENMMESASKRLEIALIYGSVAGGIGAAGAGSTDSGAGVLTAIITVGAWAAGIWSGLENCPLDCYNNAGTKLNTTQQLLVSTVDADTRTVVLTGANADTAAIAAAAVGGTGANFFFLGAYGNEFAGLDKILTNTGTLFNISASTYGLWKSNVLDAGNTPLSMPTLMKAISRAVSRGLKEKVKAYVSVQQFNDLNNELSALRRLDSSYKKGQGENGQETISYTYTNGRVEIVPHLFVKGADTFVIPTKRARRIGSTELTFNLGGMDGNNAFFTPMPNNAGYELRCFWDQGLIISHPARCVKVSNVLSSAA
mgnify:CR=1 FL=1